MSAIKPGIRTHIKGSPSASVNPPLSTTPRIPERFTPEAEAQGCLCYVERTSTSPTGWQGYHPDACPVHGWRPDATPKRIAQCKREKAAHQAEVNEFMESRHPSPERIVVAVAALPRPDRERLFEELLPARFCMSCGSDDPKCQCWNEV